MIPPDESKLTGMADEIHLISTSVRIVTDWLKILVFILVLPIVFILSVMDWFVTGTPIMSADEIWLNKVLLTVLSPWIATFVYLFRKHWRAEGDAASNALFRAARSFSAPSPSH